ncbi:hypothetical protein OKA06_01100 [Novosphingobium sp. MW5]|nr:hypothetical protein [Novosphingobium sp. MW5]
MLPVYIVREIARRSPVPVIPSPEAARSLGIDPEASPIDSTERITIPVRDFHPIDEGPIIRGDIPFDITTECFGKSAIIDCRYRYVLTLDEVKQARGRLGRSISRIMFAYDMLEWRNFAQFDPSSGEHVRMPQPCWLTMRLDRLLNAQLLRELQDKAEVQAIEVESRRR